MKNAKQNETRGVKAGTKRGKYRKEKAPRKIFSIRLSPDEQAKLNSMRGNLTMSAFIREKLGL